MINIQSTWLEYVELSQMQSWYCPSSLPDQGSLNAKVATRWLGLTGKTNLGTLMDLMKS